MQILSKCEYCSAEMKQPQIGRPRRFCSDNCRRAWWGENSEESVASPQAIYSLTCLACGEKFQSYGNRNRKYCCHEHYIAARFNQPFEAKKNLTSKKRNVAEFDETPNLQPATQENLPVLSIKSLSDTKPVLLNPNALIATEMPDNLALQRVYIFAGTSKFHGKFDYFASLVPQSLEMDLMNGDAFVFCNRSKSQISILQWQGDGFALYFKRSDFGRFPWPHYTNAEVIEITSGDLKILLEYPRFYLRLSGLKIKE